MKGKLLTYLLGFAILFAACDDFLEEPAKTGLDEDLLFEDIVTARTLLNTIYTGMPYGLPREASNTFLRNWRCMLATACDEGDGGASWTASHSQYNNGGLNASNVEQGENDYWGNYKLIRYCWTVIENIDRVPDATAEEKALFKAEAKMIMAMQYYEMIIRMGGVPWVDHVYTLNEDWKASRMPLAELVVKVENLIDESVAVLPDKWPQDVDFGRVTKGFGYFLKARLKLAIARPLFNTGAPYLSMEDAANNNLICMGNYSKERYKEAADACKLAIDHLNSQGYRLLKAEDLVDVPGATGRDAHALACRNRTVVNPEMVYYTMRVSNTNSKWTNWLASYGPRVEGNGFTQPTENFKRLYQMSSGLPQTVANGYDPNKPFENLDPRFYAAYIIHGSYFGSKYYSMALGDNQPDAEKHDPLGQKPWFVGRSSNERSRTGYHLRKLLPEQVYNNPPTAGTPIWPYMRMADLNLMYAEALNEYAGPTADVYTYVNDVRTRCGMPAAPANLDIAQMRELIEYERTIELSFEGHRYFDQKHWLKAESVFAEPIVSFDIKRDPANKANLLYSFSQLETRVFERKRLLDPFPLKEVNLKYGLVQNPGW